ncbi:hypothetical protein UFOVP1196_26 [uncultured Caudovirales phage]|uniref:Uncharacterized protein n=1 Tax=uncultured Caudovirales phage TaxID=2100421 RepID=A0A6J5R059_9CAUD|nr:hypothetical protein UFOVP1196_26 [uncultured Caudovirales phage]
MITIKFHESDIVLPIQEMADEFIEAARLEVERQMGAPLSVDPRTDFPSFTVYENGAELGEG